MIERGGAATRTGRPAPRLPAIIHRTPSRAPILQPRKPHTMARKSEPSPVAHIRELFTAAERALLDSSFGKALASASQAEVQAASRRARVLRDKWRDLTAAQGRRTKRAAAAGTNARSHEKADAFQAAVERLERRLAEFVTLAGAAIAGSRGANPKGKSRDKTIAGRAARRTTPRPEAPAPRRPAASKPAVVVAPVPVVVAPVAEKKAAAPRSAGGAKKSATAKSRKARANRAALVPQAGAQALRVDGAKQRSARTAAKAKGFATEGSKTRRTAHLIATGKRNQARRDGRKR